MQHVWLAAYGRGLVLSYALLLFFSPVFSHSLGLLVIPLVNYMTTIVILKGQNNNNHIGIVIVIDVIHNVLGCML